MKADLYTAHVGTAGSGGLAHRTAAGFVVLTSTDGGSMITLIEAQQNQPDLIDRIVAAAQSDGPDAFAMLFTAGGDLFLLASGDAIASIRSASTQLSISPTRNQVLVHPINAGINESAATVRLHIHGVPVDGVASAELSAGSLEAGWIDVSVGEDAASAIRAAKPVAVVDQPPAVEAVPAEPMVHEDAHADAVILDDDEPEPAADEVVPTESVPATAGGPPAAQEILFAEDIDEIADLIEPVAQPAAAEPAIAAAPPEAAVQAEPAVEAPVQRGPVMVLGFSCSQGHHNHPDAVYCSQCGIKMGVHSTTVLVNGPRPPLGVLVVDDGTTYSLSEDLVIGREPSSHDDVQAGTASPMVLTDDTLSLSRKHARIRLEDWSVFAIDLNSSNGTWLSRAGTAESWVKAEPHVPMALEPGDRLRVGGRIIQVELHHVR